MCRNSHHRATSTPTHRNDAPTPPPTHFNRPRLLRPQTRRSTLYQGGGLTDAEKANLRQRVPGLFDGDGNLDASNLSGETATDLKTVIDNPGGVLSTETQNSVTEAGEKYDKEYDITHG